MKKAEPSETTSNRFKEDIRLVENIDFLSVDKDNMEFEARVSCFQVDALRRLMEFVSNTHKQTLGD